MKSVVTIGGGTGQFALLSGLKRYRLDLTAIVSMADDGGSTGVLRDELGVLPPGDVRQCLVALSEAERTMRELFGYRYDQGGLRGHSFGNIFLSTLEKVTGSFERAVEEAGRILAVRGAVIPVSTAPMRLVGGAQGELQGEHAISTAAIDDPGTLRLEPPVSANPRAIAAISAADAVIIGPGDLFCSIVPNLLVTGVPEAIRASRARVVYVCNLMTKRGHTDGFGVREHLREIRRHLGAERIDAVVCNDRPPSRDLLDRYAPEGEPVLAIAESAEDLGCKVVSGSLVHGEAPVQAPGDAIKRTLIRHDPHALAALIVERILGGE